ncbi:MAG TPA: DUF3592 domain-containing protein [Terracidiphilus sp.]|jgi:hypothetical protein|nr:DUF3592 domain-containing protein [Terracidiphilus sp.]
MLIELWEKLRGYDKWLETSATVEETNVEEFHVRGGNFSESSDVLRWTDTQGNRHRTGITINDDSPLFQLVRGSSIPIRYNPADPEQFYIRELLQTRVRALVRGLVFAFVIAGILILAGLLRSR